MSQPLVSRFLEFLDASTSPFHAAKETARQLDEEGFTSLDETAAPESLPPGSHVYAQRGGSIIAMRLGSRSPVEAGFRIVCAHTDSPNLRIKPQPVMRGEGYVRLGVEVYGGAIVSTWTDRDLGISGRVVVRDGERNRTDLIDLRQPLCRIPNLAIHLNRKVNDEGLKLNNQTELPALLCQAGADDESDPFRALIASHVDCEPDDLLAWDLGLYDLAPATLAGANQEFIHSARLDNLASCHAGLEALLTVADGDLAESTAVLALFDHEEIGSTTSRGANSRFLESLLRRAVDHSEAQAQGGFDRAIASSWAISADMAHAVHPAYTDKHDKEHMPKLNAGIVLKQNVNARYTTEADTAARFLRLCESVEAPVQWFVNRSDLACGSTVGPMIASNLGIPAIDIGNAMLSMHSIREMCGASDHPHMVNALTAFYR